MEVLGAFERVLDGWVYRSDFSSGFGVDPESAYLAYLAGFEYRGPELPIKSTYGEVHSPDTKEA